MVIEVDNVELSPYFKQFFSNSHEATVEFLEFSLERATVISLLLFQDRNSKKYTHYTTDAINEEDDFYDSS